MKKITLKITNRRMHSFCRSANGIVLSMPLAADANLQFIAELFIEKCETFGKKVSVELMDSPLDELDAIRDNKYKGFFAYIVACQYSENQAEVNLAKTLLPIFERFNNLALTSENFDDQTSDTIAFLTECKKSDVFPKIQVVQPALHRFQQLEEANNAFSQGKADYEIAKAEGQNFPAAFILKRELVNYTNNVLRAYLSAMNAVKPEIYKTSYDALEHLIIDTNEQVKRHYTLLEKENNENEI